MYRGKDRIPTAKPCRLQEAEIPFLLACGCNNATKTPAQSILRKLSCVNWLEVSTTGLKMHASGGRGGLPKVSFQCETVSWWLNEEAIKGQVEVAGYTLVSEDPEVVLQSLDRNVTSRT